ncbi:hypothetical protein COOONC_27765 [Cooperia oncophora]
MILMDYIEKRCPPVFGEFECPIGFTCNENQCLARDGRQSTMCGFETECSDGTICVEGKCYPHSTIKCNRHVLTADGQARSIVSDCGKKGKCVNGQCVYDSKFISFSFQLKGTFLSKEEGLACFFQRTDLEPPLSDSFWASVFLSKFSSC